MIFWPDEGKLKEDGTSNAFHKYWWGRGVASDVMDKNLYVHYAERHHYQLTFSTRILDPDSEWYKADKTPVSGEKVHKLTLRAKEFWPEKKSLYHEGVWDGIFRRNDPSIPLPEWDSG